MCFSWKASREPPPKRARLPQGSDAYVAAAAGYRRPIHYFTDDARQLVILFDYSVPPIVQSEYPLDFARLLNSPHAAIASRRGRRPSFAKSCPQNREGAGNAGCRNAPAALRASEESTQASHHRYAEQAGIPCAMVFGLWRALPGVPGLIAPSLRQTSWQSLTSASGGQDHTLLPSAGRQALVLRRRPRPPQPASRFVTIGRNVPLDEAG
jgi:hypothetical protein